MTLSDFKFNPRFFNDEPQSKISEIYYNGSNDKETNKEVLSFLNNLSEADIKTFTKEEIKSILWIYYFGLYSFADINYVFCWDFDKNNEFINFRLKDNNYSFPELDFIKKIHVLTNISKKELFSVLEDDFYDYATYSVGEYNNDLRDEYLEYFYCFLKPAFFSDKKYFKYFCSVCEIMHVESFPLEYTEGIHEVDCPLTGMEVCEELIEVNFSVYSSYLKLINQIDIIKNKLKSI